MILVSDILYLFYIEALNQSLEEIWDAKFYSILADEVKDYSNREQLPVISRYVDRGGEIQKRFIHCDTGLTGNALKDKILSFLLNELQLDLSHCRGQCYDGAGNMAGKFSGLSSRIIALNPLALYTHCSSHRVNLCLASSCQIQSVRTMMGNVTKISNFFKNSPKRQLLLDKMVQ